MNRLSVISAMLLFACCPFRGNAQEYVGKDSVGRLRVLNPGKEVRVGLMKADTIASAPLLLVNDGNAPFTLKSIYTDCSCTVPEYSHEPVAPGDTVSINVKFNSAGRVPGEFRKILRIRSDASNRYEVAFVTGRVVRPVRKD